MKKLLAFLMIFCLFCCCAYAEIEALRPAHKVSMVQYGSEDCTLPVHFEIADAVDSDFQMTFAPYQIDYFPSEKIETLQTGDKIILFEEEYTVDSIEKIDEQIQLNGESGFCFSFTDDEKKWMTCDDGTETLSYTEMGSYTFPLADQVTLNTYRMDENGNMMEGMDERVLTPAEVKSFFEEHSDETKNNYLSASGSNSSIRVADGKVQEITIDWSSDS